MILRDRAPQDLPALLALLQRTHESVGYPVRAAAVSADWLASPDELWSHVAERDGAVVGHVALHPADGPPAAVDQWCAAVGCGAEGLAVVSRLFTAPGARGAGTALLQRAVEQARASGREAVLQVDPDGAARGFYARRGWREVGVARQQWGHRTVDAVLAVPPVS